MSRKRRKRCLPKRECIRLKRRKFAGGTEGGVSAADVPSFNQDFPGGDDRGQVAWRRNVPRTQVQALMEAGHNHEPKESAEEMDIHDAKVEDIVHRAINHPSLTEIEKLSLQLTLEKNMSFRDQEALIQALPPEMRGPGGTTKSTLHRARVRAMEKLRVLMEKEVEELYGR